MCASRKHDLAEVYENRGDDPRETDGQEEEGARRESTRERNNTRGQTFSLAGVSVQKREELSI